ncbi:hypothetical protein [uncultured Sphaerochaeta sp.]|jgi:hypothetical protein|uniref:hypothetical protein n=1 Tax=uncultured Sphaerochaeta sp. TaxID=886478 RepID=UPI002AA7EF93|nr:hypothetical protein [uncultured Sphaerochaeta sp.]
MMDGIELRGERINSRVTALRPERAKIATGLNKQVALAIPFWPEVITTTELSEKLGISLPSVTSRIATVQEEYLIFQHFKGFSRIKPDYSNIEARRKG